MCPSVGQVTLLLKAANGYPRRLSFSTSAKSPMGSSRMERGALGRIVGISDNSRLFDNSTETQIDLNQSMSAKIC